MTSVSELLARIKTRPMMYIHEKRATLLEAYVEGFLMARPRPSPDHSAISEFTDRLNNMPGVKASASMARGLMQLVGTDEAAFDEFFRQFDEFVRSHSPEIPVPSEMEICLNYVRGDGKKFVETTKDGKVIHEKEVDSLPGITVTMRPF